MVRMAPHRKGSAGPRGAEIGKGIAKNSAARAEQSKTRQCNGSAQHGKATEQR